MNKTNFTTNQHRLTVTRTFDVSLDLVWRAWTEVELLDQWWAPKPWRSQTKHMDFTEGGNRLYAMIGPQGEEHWGWTGYKSITQHEKFSGEDSFCDKEGNINKSLPTAYFITSFSEESGQTVVTMVTDYASEEHLQQVIQMGMKEGLAAAFENLDNVLEKL